MSEMEKLVPETSFFRTPSRGTTTMMRKRRRKRRMEGRKKSERRRLITTKSNERTILECCKKMQKCFFSSTVFQRRKCQLSGDLSKLYSIGLRQLFDQFHNHICFWIYQLSSQNLFFTTWNVTGQFNIASILYWEQEITWYPTVCLLCWIM